ncbi:MAG: indole-3-glycerol phosphate synthase TrpC [Verrucomicrobiota bacterium]|nr:indole-3-glycerol phosphate synthase TrpC [Verrucomicrobiota bacterium]
MTAHRLAEILDAKRTEVGRLLPRLEHLRAAALQRDDFRGFGSAIDRGPDALGLIGEIKKASPSAGVIAADFDPVTLAQQYEAAGVHAISVLTDEQFFQGHLSTLARVRQSTSLPCLRKDFIIHEAQIFEAAVAGADAILLIVAALEQPALEHLYATAEACQLETLVEVHTEEELMRALDLGAKIIGINNRDLATFEVRLETTGELSQEVPEGVILVSESGLKTHEDARQVFRWGCNAILVGESLMRAADVAAQVRELLNVLQQ